MKPTKDLHTRRSEKLRTHSAGLAMLLLAGALLPAAAMIPENVRAVFQEGCPYEDNSSGTGGQAGSCTFECKVGRVDLHVRARDKDADVTGTGKCGGNALVTCSEGDNECTDSATTTAAAPGACSGSSKESWDSGLYINCYSNATQFPGPHAPNQWCPVGIYPSPPYPRVCVDLDPWWCQQATATPCEFEVEVCKDGDGSGCIGAPGVEPPAPPSLDGPVAPDLPTAPEARPPETPGIPVISFDPCKLAGKADACGLRPLENPYVDGGNVTVPTPEQFDQLIESIGELFEPNPQGSSAQMFAEDGWVAGYVCEGWNCVQVTPICETDITLGIQTCRI